MKKLAFVLVVMSSFLGIVSWAQQAVPGDVVEFSCNSWQNSKGQHLIGSQVALVLRYNYTTGQQVFAVRTGAVVPNPTYSYEPLTEVFRGIDRASYSSQDYDVSIVLNKGRIVRKATNFYALCLMAH